MDADAWLIEQPRPRNRASLTRPSSTRSMSSMTSPHRGLFMVTVWVAPSSSPLFRGRR